MVIKNILKRALLLLMLILFCSSVIAIGTDKVFVAFDFESGADNMVDRSGNGRTGNKTADMLYSSTIFKTGLYGANSQGAGPQILVDAPRFDPGSNNLSVNLWINKSAAGADWALDHHNGAEFFSYEPNVAAETRVRLSCNSETADLRDDTVNINDGEFHMITITYAFATDEAKIYVDSVLKDTDTTVASAGVCLDNSAVISGHEGDATDQELIAYIDDFTYFFDKTLTQTEIDELYNSGDGLQYPWVAAAAPIITQATYNLTSAITSAEGIKWRTDVNNTVRTEVNQSTLTFDTDIDANCSAGLKDLNYTTMIADDVTSDCSTSEATSHSCTLSSTQALVEGNQSMYVACIGSTSLVEVANSTSGPLSVQLDWKMMGTVKNSNGVPYNNATIVLFDDTLKCDYGEKVAVTAYCTGTNSTGDWHMFTGTQSNWSGMAYDLNNVSDGPDADIQSVIGS